LLLPCQDYQTAFNKYKESLNYFVKGLECESRSGWLRQAAARQTWTWALAQQPLPSSLLLLPGAAAFFSALEALTEAAHSP